MSVELIGTNSVGVALADLIQASKLDIAVRLVSLKQGQSDLRECVARLKGL